MTPAQENVAIAVAEGLFCYRDQEWIAWLGKVFARKHLAEAVAKYPPPCHEWLEKARLGAPRVPWE